MEGKTWKVEELPELAKRNPFAAARIAADVVLEDVAALQLAADREAMDDITVNAVKAKALKLSTDLARLQRFMTEDVMYRVSEVTPPVQVGKFDAESYLDLVWQVGCTWLQTMVLCTKPSEFAAWANGDVETDLDPTLILKDWGRIASLQIGASGTVSTEAISIRLFKEYQQATAGTPTALPPQPSPPVFLKPAAKVLRGWPQILSALGMKKADQRNLSYQIQKVEGCPIQLGDKGQPPQVTDIALLQWWNEKVIAGIDAKAEAKRNASATVANNYEHGKSARVVPEIGGHIKPRKR